jgi:hypothetical protein
LALTKGRGPEGLWNKSMDNQLVRSNLLKSGGGEAYFVHYFLTHEVAAGMTFAELS